MPSVQVRVADLESLLWQRNDGFVNAVKLDPVCLPTAARSHRIVAIVVVRDELNNTQTVL